MAGVNGQPLTPSHGRPASVDQPSTWGTYEEAVAAARNSKTFVGFVLTEKDPYCIVDLDNKLSNPATPEEQVTFEQILAATSETYQEVSRSGRGRHVVVRGVCGPGRRVGHIEMYDRDRFMIFTGASNGKPILEMQTFVDQMKSVLPRKALSTPAPSLEQVLTDAEVVEMGLRASNGEKFRLLTEAPDLWRDVHPSQSEADHALIGMLWFYSRNAEQVMRIFRASPLGQRDKATRDDYILGTLNNIRAKEPPPVDITIQVPTPAPRPARLPSRFRPAPGVVGMLANEFLSWSTRPVLEIATAAALGAITGIVARSYNYSGTGLNQYLFLLAETGRGKEEVHKCINRLFKEMSTHLPGVQDIIGPAEFASPQAVVKTMSRKPLCMSIVGEFGDELEQMTNPKNVQKNGVRKVLLNIYNKSGEGNMLHGSAYADSEKNIAAIPSPALTLIGECTIEGYYRGMDLANVANGLIPRFLSIQYHGKRVPLRKNPKQESDPGVIRKVSDIACSAISLQQSNNVVHVQASPEAERLLDEFNELADDKINNADNTLSSELWNRAHFKCFRVAAVLAVADNPHNPIITLEHAEWAEWLVTEDLKMTVDKFEAGDIGVGDAKQIADLRRAITTFFQTSPAELVTAYAVPPDLIEKRLVPYIYLQRRTSGLASFKNDRLGATIALKRAVEELVATGEIQELARSQAHATVNYTGRVFFVKQVLG